MSAGKALDRGISLGMVIAAGIVAKSHGEDGIAEEILTAAGLTTMEDMRRIGADPYDVGALRHVLAQIKARVSRGGGE